MHVIQIISLEEALSNQILLNIFPNEDCVTEMYNMKSFIIFFTFFIW